MLGGHHHRVDADGLVVLVVLHRDLGLAVGPEIVHLALLADLGELHSQLLGQGDGQGHQLRGLVAGVAEHHALVTGAVVQAVVLAALLGLQALVHAHGDIPRLLVDRGDDGAGLAVKAELGPVIADLLHHLAGQLGDIHIAGGGDFPHDVDQAGGRRGLAGHPGLGVLGDDGVQHRVGNLVADFVGMSLSNGFGCKESLCHNVFLLSDLGAQKTPRRTAERYVWLHPHLSIHYRRI